MAFFLEATFVGLFFFGWDKLSKLGHLFVTWMVAIGSNLSALWILIANGWMQNPVGAEFNFQTMRMELTNMYEVFFNPVAQAKFVHTVAAGYVTGAIFVMSISAFYLLRKRNIAFAKRSMTVAASFGLASALSVVVLGDESGYTATEHQKMKIAAIEAMWETEEPPASFTLFGFPNLEDRTTHYEISVPWALGLIATRSIDKEVPGIKNLVEQAERKIRTGMQAYESLQILRANPDNQAARKSLRATVDTLGYGLLLTRYTDKIVDATDEQITQAAWDTVPRVAPLFWSFRFMVGLGFYFIAFFAFAFYLSARRRFERYRWFLWLSLFSLPLPWISCELGWFVAEYGRQPWAIEGVLPTYLGVSSVSAGNVLFSLIGFIVFYSALAVVDVFLMIKYVRIGPYGKHPAPAAEPAPAE